MRTFLHGGPEKLAVWQQSMDLLGHDPELKNTLEFNDMTPKECQEDLWRRMKVLIEKHGIRYFKTDSMFKYPYVDTFAYF